MSTTMQLYDYLDEVIHTERIRQIKKVKLKYYLSELCQKMGMEEEEDVQNTMFRIQGLCKTMQISFPDNCRKIYRYNGTQLQTDFMLSPLVCYLFMLNGNPESPQVAYAQVLIATKGKGFF